ncbi:KAP family P-loop NTPase fold protein [Streptococcus himalayensis]|uniref:KAP NTPase domain-containing protein n=1 Tax=Streptococcus himalayensis TaxID=1888195 RepID=A0A917A6W9_9STRE|nr:P-loop NTPase fold protein [Streptococcus himalayensis]GGE30727.1 hypothetical protein GCM10011510_09990 [Streptococcus himalayensis]
MTHSTVTDTPSVKDLFEIKKYIDGLTDFIRNCKTPMTLAIQGDWGVGKTSIMQQIKEKLDNKVETVFLNTWQYSQFNFEENLSISLLVELVTELSSKLGEGKEYEKTKSDIFNIIGNIAIAGISTAISNATLGFVDISGIEEKFRFGDTSKKDILLQPSIQALRELNNGFKELVNKVLEKQRKERIVFFIDDLDRLNPLRAVELLEVMKLFLESDKCVFVLAIDYNVVAKGVRLKYKDEIEEDKIDSFFEKIIQVPFIVPTHVYNMENYIKELFKDLHSHDISQKIEQIKNLILNSIGSNPRNIKRLFNSFSLLLSINDLSKASKIENSEDMVKLLATLCLQMKYKEVYDYLATSENFNIPELIDTGDLEIPDDFSPFKDALFDIFKNNWGKLGEKIKISGVVSSGKKTVEQNTENEEFWKGFTYYNKNTENKFNYRHSGNQVTSRYYRVFSNEDNDFQCEFLVNKNSIGLVYGNVKDQKINDILKKKVNIFTEAFKSENVAIREWKDKSKNNYNHIPGINIKSEDYGLNSYGNYNAAYEWYVQTLNKVSELLQEQLKDEEKKC